MHMPSVRTPTTTVVWDRRMVDGEILLVVLVGENVWRCWHQNTFDATIDFLRATTVGAATTL